MARFRLGRRAFLAGVGGTSVALPFLEAMTDSATAQTGDAPKRYMIAYGGIALGQLSEIVPATVGAGYELTRALAPIGRYDGLQQRTSIVTNLVIPWATSSGAPAAGRVRDFHGSTESPLLSGMRSTDNNYRLGGPSSDILVAEAIAEDTRFASISYRAQAEHYRAGGDGPGIISYARNDAGTVERRPPIVSPRTAFESLFVGFAPADPAEIEQRRILLERGRSVLDLVRRRGDRLESRLGIEDKRRLERHFTEIRELERRVAEAPPPAVGQCMLLADPGEDPAARVVDGEDARAIGWADETTRARLFADLIHMAFTCDLTRSVALQMTFSQSFLSAVPIVGRSTDVHELGHNGTADLTNLSDVYAWHLEPIAYLADKLASTPEAEGSVLDNTAIVFVTEAGRGYDPVDDADGRSHSSENMVALVIGGAGGLAGGRHIAGEGRHPAQAIVSAMQAVGGPTALGEVSEGIPELFG